MRRRGNQTAIIMNKINKKIIIFTYKKVFKIKLNYTYCIDNIYFIFMRLHFSHFCYIIDDSK